MSNVRLTKQTRQVVLKRLLDGAFGKRREEILEAEHELGDLVYADAYSREVQEKMAALPEGFLPDAVGFSIYVGGQYHLVKLREARRVAYGRNDELVGRYPASSKVASRLASIERDKRRLEEDESRARSEARAVLGSCATVRQLVETWPEVEPYVRDFAEKPAETRALTVSIPRLNEHLGLSRSRS